MESYYKQLIEKQRAFFETGATRKVSFRINNLKRLKETIIKNYDLIIKALQEDLHKSEFESLTTEVMGIEEELNMAIKKLHIWTTPRRVRTPLVFFKSSSRYYYEPYGCVLIISAWNYPFFLSLIPVINAIAAGNCCIVKPSEIAPHASVAIAKIIKASFSEEYCAVCEGGIPETTALLAEHVDFIHYTGSTRVGKIVAAAAANHLTPTVLELGGKSPCIVDETADLKTAARRICWGKFTNAGQICVAPDYLFVHESVKARLLEMMQKTLVGFYGENPIQSPDYAHIINEKHFDRLVHLLQAEKIISGGEYDRQKLCITPTLLEISSQDSKIMEDEIFGPLLPVMTYQDLSQVITYINRKHKNPLALYLFSNDKNNQKRILDEVSFGGGGINTTILHVGNSHLPFGGVGNSGMGNYHGKHGFETFSHKKSILKKSNWIDLSFQYPPFKKRARLFKSLLLK